MMSFFLMNGKNVIENTQLSKKVQKWNTKSIDQIKSKTKIIKYFSTQWFELGDIALLQSILLFLILKI